ncbi:hypothetical protein [Enterovirga aerilata]|uniref:Uncharacterized protein n=1 Tax=Enterovirga aerilata TaxID=2730920 RepID=A0A849ICT3_9HYPH|nr:hypothetical protein [Enterovirga sp. DB1703]NNM71733.1 hypothetical protein [Enterovirga sp. DB1703]
MYKFLKRSLLGAMLVLAVLAIGRVAVSFAIVAATVSQTLSANGDHTSIARVVTQATSGFSSLAGTLNPGYRRTISVLDVPAEIESRRKARDVKAQRGGPLILTIGD